MPDAEQRLNFGTMARKEEQWADEEVVDAAGGPCAVVTCAQTVVRCVVALTVFMRERFARQLDALERREAVAGGNALQLRILVAAVEVAADKEGIAGEEARGDCSVKKMQVVHALVGCLLIAPP